MYELSCENLQYILEHAFLPRLPKRMGFQ